MGVLPPLAFKAGFEGVPVILVKQLVVIEVLTYSGRLQKLYIGSWVFKRHFLGPLHFLHPLSGGCRTRLRIWDEQLVYYNGLCAFKKDDKVFKVYKEFKAKLPGLSSLMFNRYIDKVLVSAADAETSAATPWERV